MPFDNPGGDGGSVILEDLDCSDREHEEDEEKEEGNDVAVRPVVGAATQLEDEEQADERGDDQEGPQGVELEELLFERHRFLAGGRGFEEACAWGGYPNSSTASFGTNVDTASCNCDCFSRSSCSLQNEFSNGSMLIKSGVLSSTRR